MKESYRILSLFFVLLSPATFAEGNNNQADINAEISAGKFGSGRGSIPDPSHKEEGIIAHGSGHGATPDPTTTTSQQVIPCIQGVCLRF